MIPQALPTVAETPMMVTAYLLNSPVPMPGVRGGSFSPQLLSPDFSSSLSPDSFSPTSFPTSHSLAPGLFSPKPAPHRSMWTHDHTSVDGSFNQTTGHSQHVLQQLSQAGICHGFHFPLVSFAWSKPSPSPSRGEVAGHSHQGFSPFLQDLLIPGQSLCSAWSWVCLGCSGETQSSSVLGWVSLGWEEERFLEQLVWR